MSPSPVREHLAAPDAGNRVFVIGAGFTRALVPDAPLLIDDFGNDDLAQRVRGLPNASRLLEWERSRHPRGQIDIERLMTRVESLMPYDHAEFSGNAANEYALLLSELKRSFLDRVHGAGEGVVHRDELARFARHCATTASPHISPGAAMIAEDFGSVRVLATESIAGTTVEVARARTGPKDPRGRGQRSLSIRHRFETPEKTRRTKQLHLGTSGLVRYAG